MIKAAKSESRSRWAHPIEFLLSCVGYSVGLGNVWRFPYLCFQHGGASFLLVYIFLQLTIGKPLYFLELTLGQYVGKGPVRAWDIVPAARGIGLTMILISLSISLYYNVLMAYIFYFFFSSFMPELPWNKCNPAWNEPDCYDDHLHGNMSKLCQAPAAGAPPPHEPQNCTCTRDKAVDVFYPDCVKPPPHSTDLFFTKDVIQESANLSDFGVPSWRLALCLFLAWLTVFICINQGIKSSGKVVYVTATFPYLVLIMLLIRGLLLDGAVDGVRFFMVPDWSKMKSFQLWIDAAGQMFFSLGLSMGGIIMFGSYNPFRHPVGVDAIIISTMDLFTSVLAGFVIFSTFGYMAKKTGSTIAGVAKGGFGLAFIAYPKVLSTLALPQLWSVLFFIMLFTLGLDSQFALLETALTYFMDDFVWIRRRKVQVRIVVCLVLYLLGLILCAPGGQYIIGILDTYTSSYAMALIALLECISINWVYGIGRYLNDLEYMLGSKLKCLPFWYFVWVFWDPFVLTVLFVVTLGLSDTPKYNDGSYFGPGVMALCWLLYAFTLLPVPLWFVFHVLATKRKQGYQNFTQFRQALMAPSERFGPADGLHVQTGRPNVTVWADVLDWECWQRREDGISSASEVAASQPGVLPPPAPASQDPGASQLQQPAESPQAGVAGQGGTAKDDASALSSSTQSSASEKLPDNPEVPASEVPADPTATRRQSSAVDVVPKL